MNKKKDSIKIYGDQLDAVAKLVGLERKRYFFFFKESDKAFSKRVEIHLRAKRLFQL